MIEGDQQTSHDADRIRATGAPAIQVNPANKLSFFASLHTLPVRSGEDNEKAATFMAGIVGRQHPDHDTENWQPETDR